MYFKKAVIACRASLVSHPGKGLILSHFIPCFYRQTAVVTTESVQAASVSEHHGISIAALIEYSHHSVFPRSVASAPNFLAAAAQLDQPLPITLYIMKNPQSFSYMMGEGNIKKRFLLRLFIFIVHYLC